MPAWLRSLQSTTNAPPDAMPGAMPGGMPGPGMPTGPGAPNQPWGMPSIPAGAASAPAPSGQPGAFGGPPGGPPAPQSLSVSSLISNDALPDWIRSAPAPTPMPAAQWGQSAAGGMAWGVTPPPMGQSSALFDDAALPEWLRAAVGQSPAGGPASGGAYAPAPNPLPGMSPGSAYDGYTPPAPGPYGPSAAPASPFGSAPQAPALNGSGNGYANGYANGSANGMAGAPPMAAQPLFDAASLPAWLGGTASPSTPLLTEPPAGAGNMAANALVDPSVLPQWMRDAPAPRQEPSASSNASTVSQWLASPVTDEPLPGFLDQIYADAEVPRLDPAGSPAALGGEPIVDAGALPAWLRMRGDAGAGPGVSQGLGGFAGAESVPLPPPVLPQAAGYGVPGYAAPAMPPAGEQAAAPLFSARELVEPDAMPAWAQPAAGPNGGQTPAALEMSGASPEAPSRWPDQDAGQAAAYGADQDYEQAAEPAHGGGASQPGRSWPPRGDQPAIPAGELPPWLREGQPPAAAGAADGYAGFEEYQGYAAGDLPMDPMDQMDPMDPMDQPPGEFAEARTVEHYADRFGNERPGISGRFGYEYDYGQGGPLAPEPPPAPAGRDDRDRKGGKRRGFFRRR